MLSIDIGIHNLGYSYLSTDEKLYFNIYDLDNSKNKGDIIIERTKAINIFIKDLFTKYTDIHTVIIEKQVNANTMAMEIMYLLTATIYNFCNNIIIFDPKKKFTTLSIKYDTKNKQHKKLSINIMDKYINKYFNDNYSAFNNFSKKDDVADSLFMLLIHKYKNNKEKLLDIVECYNSI